MGKSQEINENLAKSKANLKLSIEKLRGKSQKLRKSKKIPEKWTGIKENMIHSKGNLTEKVQNLKSDHLVFYGLMRSIPVAANLMVLEAMDIKYMTNGFKDLPVLLFSLILLQAFSHFYVLFDNIKCRQWMYWYMVAIFNIPIALVAWRQTMGITYCICPTICLCLDAIMLVFSLLGALFPKKREGPEFEEIWWYEDLP